MLAAGIFLATYLGVDQGNLPAATLARLGDGGLHIDNPHTLAGVSLLLSNLVSNVPAVMLLIRFIDPADSFQWYTLAVSSTFAGNLILIGSIANLIVVEQARDYGIYITFTGHLAAGVPVTLFSMAVLAGWNFL